MLTKSLEEDAKNINNILFQEDNISIKENMIIDIIKKYNLKQRLLLRLTYDKLYPKNNFFSDLNSNLSLSVQFCNLVTSLFMDRIDIDCIEPKKIFDEISNNSKIIIEEITLNPFWHNQRLIKVYFELYNKDLNSEIFKEFLKI